MGNVISSRTPEGEPNCCPVCRGKICIEPSQPSGDAPCPRCGTLLWFFDTGEGTRYHESENIAPIREKVLEAVHRHLGAGSGQVDESKPFIELVVDSLDTVELVMELEEEFGLTASDTEIEGIKTVAAAIDFIARYRQHH